MSPKIESSRPPQLSRPEVPSQVSPTGTKAASTPSAAPRPISDGFSREASSAAAQASRGAQLEGVGTPLARDLGANAPNSTSMNQEPYHLGLGIENGTTVTGDDPNPPKAPNWGHHDAVELTSATLKVKLPGDLPFMSIKSARGSISEEQHVPWYPVEGGTAPPADDTNDRG